jgi:hypothetical protein
MSSASVASDLERMTNLLNHIMALSTKIGGFSDGPHLREEIQVDIRNLTLLCQSTKTALLELKENGSPSADDHIARFNELRGRIQQDLPGVVQKLRGSSERAASGQSASFHEETALDQSLLDGESDLIDILEQQVNEILITMREVNQLFGETLEQLQAQRHILTAIETHTSEAVSEMGRGNEALEEAKEKQKLSTKCLCWIFIIVTLVAVAVVLIILSQTIWKKTVNPPPGTETPFPPDPPPIPDLKWILPF